MVQVRRAIGSRRQLLILVNVGITKSLFDIVISTNGFILEDRYGQTVLSASLYTAAFAVSCAMGSWVSGQLSKKPTEVMMMFTPLVLLAALALVLAGIMSESMGGYLSSIAFLQFAIFPPIMSFHAEFSQDLNDIAGVATSVDLFSQYMLSSVISLLGIWAAEQGTRAMLFTMACLVILTELITRTGICPPTSFFGEALLLSAETTLAQK